MAKYQINIQGRIENITPNKIRQLMKDNPKSQIRVSIMSNMPLKLHNEIAEHNKKI